MTSKRRQREYARRRYEKWQAHQAEVQARARRRRLVVGAVLGALALAAGVWLVVDLVTSVDGAPGPVDAPAPDGTAAPPDPALAEDRTWTVTLATTAGDVVVELDGTVAPQAVASFVSLARDGWFTDTRCHRLTVSGIYVLQCGDPTGTGTGGPDYRFGPVENDPADDFYPAGTVAMARVGGEGYSMGSQFFLVYADSTITSDAAGGYTVFGRVLEGMDVLVAVAAPGVVDGTVDTPIADVTIEGVELE